MAPVLETRPPRLARLVRGGTDAGTHVRLRDDGRTVAHTGKATGSTHAREQRALGCAKFT